MNNKGTPECFKKYTEGNSALIQSLPEIITAVVAFILLIVGKLISSGSLPEVLFLKHNETKYQFFIFLTFIFIILSFIKYKDSKALGRIFYNRTFKDEISQYNIRKTKQTIFRVIPIPGSEYYDIVLKTKKGTEIAIPVPEQEKDSALAWLSDQMK